MGGFTKIQLLDTSEENIQLHNELLSKHKVKKSFKFYTVKDIELEYEAFKNGEGTFPEHLFPRDKIKSFKSFRKYWSPEAIGDVFCPPIGSLTFDACYGRTSDNAMKCIKDYLIDAMTTIDIGFLKEFCVVSGSFSVFMERCSASKINKELLSKIREKW
jgi:hypothetical protein